jgi:hypothetical protein
MITFQIAYHQFDSPYFPPLPRHKITWQEQASIDLSTINLYQPSHRPPTATARGTIRFATSSSSSSSRVRVVVTAFNPPLRLASTRQATNATSPPHRHRLCIDLN